MADIKISVVNSSTVLTDSEVQAAIPALQIQISQDFAPVWGVGADLEFVPRGAQPASDHWWLVILDNSDQSGALGYHDLTPNSLPLGKVFAGSDQQVNAQWTVTASHELLEMLGDPDINLCATVTNADGSTRLYAYEVADACETDEYGYYIKVGDNNILVADFVYPAWFEAFREPNSTQFDHQKKITAPFQLLPGGYIGILDINSTTGWTQLTAQGMPGSYDMRARVGSRRERRRIPRSHWQKSRPTGGISKPRTRLQTFRSPVYSLMQSALHQTLKRRGLATHMSADHPAMKSFHEAANRRIKTPAHSGHVAARFADSAPGSPAVAASASVVPASSVSAALTGPELYAELGSAEIAGNAALRDELENQLRYGTSDILWIECWTTYKAWMESGTPIPYMRYQQLSDFVLDLPQPQAADGHLVIGVIGDWGTGMDNAGWLLSQVLAQKIDVLIHLGDIYYSGTVSEVSDNFLNMIAAAGVKVPIYTLAGNHDMYSGGAGYYKLLGLLGQPASYFCLRNPYWQILGLDTGYHDSDVFTVDTNLTDLDDDEAAWHLNKINTAGGRRTILLSHHQLFSPFDKGVGQDPTTKEPLANNPRLYNVFKGVIGQIALWIWGHEHSCNIFQECNGLVRGRCVGASAVPARASEAYQTPSTPLSLGATNDSPPQPLAIPALIPDPAAPAPAPDLKLKVNGSGDYFHCYAILRLNATGPDGVAEYYQIDSANSQLPILFYSEPLQP